MLQRSVVESEPDRLAGQGEISMQNQWHQVLLQVSASEAFVALVNSFVETAAVAFCLGRTEALALTLAAEEVFQYLCRRVLPEGQQVDLICSGGGYFVRLEFAFTASDLDLRAFNITATASLSDEAGLEEMGLLLASRSVDRFKVVRGPGQVIKLTLTKEKVYAAQAAHPTLAPPKMLEKFALRTPDSEELKLMALLIASHYDNQMLPGFFAYPGKLVDMAQGGELRSSAAIGPAGEMGGGIFWRWIGAKGVECFGPYLFNQGLDSPIPNALLDCCIGAIARTSAVMLISRYPTAELLHGQFEYLGSTLTHARDGTHMRRDAWARMLQEDIGSTVWVDPQLSDFVERQYSRLVLPREIRLVKNLGEQRPPHSVLLTTFERPRSSAWIEPISLGKDYETNLIQHMEFLQRDGILNVFFTLDLGQSWQAELTAGLLQQGFEPCLLLPYSGTGDEVVFQLRGPSS